MENSSPWRLLLLSVTLGSTSSAWQRVRVQTAKTLLDQITNVDPWDTPWVSQAPKVAAQHVYHEWLKDTLYALGGGTDTDITTAGGVEGADYSYENTTSPSREFNVTMIFRQDIGVSETQRHVNPAGFKDAYAYEIQKATKRLAIKLEKVCFATVTTATGASATARVMRSFQSFITTNTARPTAPSGADATHDGVVSVTDFENMLNVIYNAGGNPEQVYVSPSVKRQLSAFSVPGASSTDPRSRNIAMADKKIVSAIDFYDSNFGLIQIVLDRWVPESTNLAGNTATANATATGGKIFFLQRSINRLAWLRPMQHFLVGKRGDSVAGIVVGEVTLEVLNEKANGMLANVNNRSSVT
jgi:hypothetical protein